MANNNIPPPPEPDQPRKGLLSRWDRFFLIVCMLILVYVGLKKCGIDPVERSEQIEMTDDPHK